MVRRMRVTRVYNNVNSCKRAGIPRFQLYFPCLYKQIVKFNSTRNYLIVLIGRTDQQIVGPNRLQDTMRTTFRDIKSVNNDRS